MGRRLVPGLLAVLVLAGCSSAAPDPSPTVPVAHVVEAADCMAPQVLAALDLTPAAGTAATVPSSAAPHVDAPAPGRVPSTFVATGAVECTPGGTLVDSAGTWSSVRARRLDGDTTALEAALALAPAPTSQGCTPAPVSRLDLWLVDALGRAVRASLPEGACGGGPRAEITTALDALEVTDTATYPVGLLEPAPNP
ncbi:hypothetical protein [Cellulomonas sp. PhB150]|uniref:hypothetical protein n=1 Tax=Cellulomonas sp. PhB150 TaxID=2485188 RepID=UPI000FBED232|nr:hypothetical protein [Cellulomonas sp. PhB150]ROS31472.1 hypothetical protein EDF34_1131 [Cellulomonas sp. PhB150]